MMAEEVEEELEAVQAVYEGDCMILQRYPPHLSVALKPCTADDPSLQFVEAVLVIKASEQYPTVIPDLELQDTKGLDDKRHAKFLYDLLVEVRQLSPGPMLVAISEAAKDLLTSMNVPDGDCCFCMLPLVMPDSSQGSRPFMKLMSCFHCFHSDCFGRWWRWLLQSTQLEENSRQQLLASERALEKSEEPLVVQCPVCRKVIHPSDVAHVREFLTAGSPQDKDIDDEENEVLESVINYKEVARRAKFAAEFEAQQARGAIIEPKKLEVILPGMVLPVNPNPPNPSLVEGEPAKDLPSSGPSDIPIAGVLVASEIIKEESTPGHGKSRRDHGRHSHSRWRGSVRQTNHFVRHGSNTGLHKEFSSGDRVLHSGINHHGNREKIGQVENNMEQALYQNDLILVQEEFGTTLPSAMEFAEGSTSTSKVEIQEHGRNAPQNDSFRNTMHSNGGGNNNTGRGQRGSAYGGRLGRGQNLRSQERLRLGKNLHSKEKDSDLAL